ncbi:MAG: DUF58 domain-containing protein [Actinobacteria bacterium]|nr:DUF58 domain-containing protein [Actinomycetota bacterium]
MTRRASPRLGAYAGLAGLGLLAALVLGLPELVVLVSPFALLLAVGVALGRAPRVRVQARLGRERALEGEEVPLELGLTAETAVEHLEVLLALPAGLELPAEENPVGLTLRAGEERTLELGLRCARWGAYSPGEIVLRARDRLGLFMWEEVVDRREPLRVYPRPERLLSLLKPLETQASSGNQVSREKGDGIEFADMRGFAAGDRMRRINWRASARRGELVVNEFHPERNTDVILFLDSFSELRGPGEGTLDLTVRAAAALAERYLARKDRVGIVGFGGILRWLLPASGLVQLYRIVDSLLDTEVVLNYAWKDIDVIPRRTLPPKALVVGLTPLLDERAVRALLDLRARGFDLAVIEISPAPFVPAAPGEAEELAHRLWLLERAALRYRFEAAGVPVAEWRDGTSLAGPLEEVSAYRRHARVSRG